MYIEQSAPEQGAAVGDPGAAWSIVGTLVAAVDAALGKWLGDTYGIGLTEYRAALHLSRASDNELRINDLAHKVGLNQSSVTRLVGRMEAKQLAFRDTCPDDGRGVYAVITDRGKEAVADIRQPYEAKLRELLAEAGTLVPQLDAAEVTRSLDVVAGLLR